MHSGLFTLPYFLILFIIIIIPSGLAHTRAHGVRLGACSLHTCTLLRLRYVFDYFRLFDGWGSGTPDHSIRMDSTYSPLVWGRQAPSCFCRAGSTRRQTYFFIFISFPFILWDLV